MSAVPGGVATYITSRKHNASSISADPMVMKMRIARS